MSHGTIIFANEYFALSQPSIETIILSMEGKRFFKLNQEEIHDFDKTNLKMSQLFVSYISAKANDYLRLCAMPSSFVNPSLDAFFIHHFRNKYECARDKKMYINFCSISE